MNCCSSCGESASPTDSFCSSCGEKLNEQPSQDKDGQTAIKSLKKQIALVLVRGELDRRSQESSTKEHIVSILEQICSDLRDAFSANAEISSHIENSFNRLKSRLFVNAIYVCLDEYIRTELDFKTPGDRGLGRVSTSIPRLGAYFRKQLAGFTNEELQELHFLIEGIILSGYLGHALFAEERVVRSKDLDEIAIYNIWIPNIYCDASALKAELLDLLGMCANPHLVSIQDFLNRHNMKRDGFLQKDKTNEILFYYLLAGFALRASEMSKQRVLP